MLPSNEQVMLYIDRMGERGKKTLSILGKHQPFITAINTEVGREIMNDVLSMHETMLNKIASFTATDEDKADYRALTRIINLWATKIADYEKKISEITYIAKGKKKDG